MTNSLRARRVEIVLVLTVLVLDQVAKAIVRAELPLFESLVVVRNVLNITHVRNTGAAFGLLDSVDFPLKTPLLALFATAALILVASYAASLAHHQRIARAGLALIVGGAAGNLIDRVTTGSVLDFVDVYWRSHHFWTFNVADSAITIGVAMMILDMLGSGEHVSEAA
jgi:signal peptidase II